MMKNNPFTGMIPGRPNVGAVDADSRIRMVQSFTMEQCKKAIHVPGLQATVITAIIRRVRKLKAEDLAK